MTEQKIKEIESKCILKSKDDFISSCEKHGILSEWYSFEYDKNKPVCFAENSVYYGEFGVTNCAVKMCVWDIGMEKLLQYKKEFEWRDMGASLKIDSVEPKYIYKYNMRAGEYPIVTVHDYQNIEETDESMISAGWIDGGWMHYDGIHDYYRYMDIRDNLTGITIHFTKKTEERDRSPFGFKEDYMHGSYCYPIPDEMADEVARYAHDNVRRSYDKRLTFLPDNIRDRLMEKYGEQILDDEYTALCKLKEAHLKALLDAVDTGLSQKDQQYAFVNAGKKAEAGNPALDNLYGSRSSAIIHNNFALAYQKAGIEQKERSVRDTNLKFGNVNTDA